jgi:hypothetical protein
MKVFTNGYDTVAAESIDDVPGAWASSNGVDFYDEGGDLYDWDQVDDDKLITICNVHDGGADDKETRTAREWAEKDGRGLLCSTEW